MKKLLASFLALTLVIALAACGGGKTDSSSTTSGSPDSSNSGTISANVETEQAAEPDDTGFTEFPIFEDEEVGFLNVSAVYFQPVPMSHGNENIEDFDIHLECDVSALPNDVGFGLGDWVPYMTVDYKVVGGNGSGDVAAQGTFMVMSASDGPHYGSNIKLDKADTYAVTFTFHNPEENGYLVHTDAETGPGGLFDTIFAGGNLTVTVGDWDYTPQEW